MTIQDEDLLRQHLLNVKQECARLKEELRVAEKIEGSFWDALKLLNLSGIDVNNPGSHVAAVIAERNRYKEALERIVVMGFSWWVSGNEIREIAKQALENKGKPT
jgi:hypothetical protein